MTKLKHFPFFLFSGLIYDTRFLTQQTFMSSPIQKSSPWWKKGTFDDIWQKIIISESLKIIYGEEELDFIFSLIIY